MFIRNETPKSFCEPVGPLFSSRRKTVRNNLSQFLKNNELAVECLNLADIDIMKRAEVLTIEQLLKLSDIINQKTGEK